MHRKYQVPILMMLFHMLFFKDEMEVNGSSDAATMKSVCVRTGCNNPAVESDDWDKEYCSNECVATHCRCVRGLKHLTLVYILFPTDIREFSELNVFCFSETYSGRGARSGIRPWQQ